MPNTNTTNSSESREEVPDAERLELLREIMDPGEGGDGDALAGAGVGSEGDAEDTTSPFCRRDSLDLARIRMMLAHQFGRRDSLDLAREGAAKASEASAGPSTFRAEAEVVFSAKSA